MKITRHKKEKVELLISPEAINNSKTGLMLLKKAIEEVIELNPDGVKNTELARHLGLETDFNGNQRNYLTYSLLGLLMKEHKIFRDVLTKRFKKPIISGK
ncbi:MAG: hypothetical protein V1775_18950 [Bacteroidota bacterium]